MKKIYDIENSIEELKKWVEKNPTIPVSSQVKDEFFEDKSKLKEEYEKMRKLYGYLRVERSRKHMTDEQIDRCKEANIGGVFGYSKKYEDIAKAWRCSTESLLEILKQYGTIEKFYNAYVKNEIDTYKLPKYIEIERIFPRVHDMEMNNDINYNRLASAIDRANSRGELYYYSKSHLEKAITTLTEREMKVIKLRFGLEDGKFRNLEEVGKEFNVTRERIRQIEAKALRKLRHPSRNVLTKLDLEQLTEEEVKEILEANKKLSITDTPIEEKEKSNEIIKKYIQRQNENVYKLSEEEQKTVQENKTVKQVSPSNKFEDMAINNFIHDKNITMSVRLYNCLRRSTLRTEKVKDLLKMNIEEIRKIGSLGKKTEEELVNILDKKGYVLDKNGNFVKKEEPVKKNNEEIQMVYKTPEIIKKGIETLRKENEEKQQQIELVDELMALFDEQEELKAKNSQLDEEIKRKLAILEGKGFTITYGKK